MKDFLDKLDIGSVYRVIFFDGANMYYSFSEKGPTNNFFNSKQSVLFLGVKEDLEEGCHIFKFLISGKYAYVTFSSDYVNNNCLKFVKVKNKL